MKIFFLERDWTLPPTPCYPHPPLNIQLPPPLTSFLKLRGRDETKRTHGPDGAQMIVRFIITDINAYTSTFILLLLTISVAIAIVLDISVFSKRKFNVNLDAIFDSIVSWVDIHNVINFII